MNENFISSPSSSSIFCENLNPQSNIYQAINAVKTNFLNILEASQKYGIPQNTLHSHLEKTYDENIRNLGELITVKEEFIHDGETQVDRYSVF